MLGWHWLAHVHDAPPEALASTARVRALLAELPASLGLRPVAPAVVSEIEGGLAGMVLLAESHAAVHTAIADRSAFVDVFSCRSRIDVDRAEAVVARHLPGTVHARLVRRGPDEAP